MIPFELKLIAAVGLDLLAGDPRWLPHPVRLIGSYASVNELFWREQIRNRLTAGFAAWLTVVLTVIAVTGVILWLSGLIHPLAKDISSIFVLYFCIAVKDLSLHGERVRNALRRGDIQEARLAVSFLVSRDTTHLEEEELLRAAVESLSENSSDGITAPLFYAVIGGPILVMVYKAVSTLDSMFGYKTERYLRFGYVSAKADDIFNYIPARITAFCTAVMSFIVGGTFSGTMRIVLRDGDKNPSPNAGVVEAAFAGALGVRLGGESTYFGKTVQKQRIGDPLQQLHHDHIEKSKRLFWAAGALFLCIGIIIRTAFNIVV